MNKNKLYLIGLLQAIGVVAYCFLIGGFFWIAKEYLATPPGILGTILMLIILVFSAAATGSIVFGYPAYLTLKHNNIKSALIIFAYTLLYCFIFIIISIIILAV